MPGLSVTAEYRFMDMPGRREIRRHHVTTAGGPATLTAGAPSSTTTFLIGVRYAFDRRPAAAAGPGADAGRAPAPAPARSYLVFFDWDKATLTDRAQQIIKEAADNSTRVQYTRIEVNGYTDTSGHAAVQPGAVDAPRAERWRAELVRDGVPQNAISIQGFGETHLLVPTGAGVREPQNRRVEIIIR